MTWPCMLALSMGVLLCIAGGVVFVLRIVRMGKDEPVPVPAVRTVRRVSLAEYRADMQRWERMASEGGVRVVVVIGEDGRTYASIEGDEIEDVPTPRQGRRRT